MKKKSLTDQLSAGIEQLQERRLKRDWRICPKCMKRAVRRDLRRCGSCRARLLFPGDTASSVIGDWFLWHRSVFGLEGWYHRSFWESGQPYVPSGVISLH